jgi:hypothetical protein
VPPLSRHRRARSSFALFVAAATAACAGQPPRWSADVGYTRLALRGRLSLDEGGGGGAQDIGSAFGLGSERGSPLVRVAADLGVPELAVSGFWIHEEGNGVLEQPFGGLAAGTPVTSDLDLGVAKLTGAFAFAAGPLTIAPGVLFDVFAIDFRASSSPSDREEVDEIVGVPMPYVRVHAPLGPFVANAELAWIDADLIGVDSRFADLEASLALRASSRIDVLAGYRLLDADGEGSSSTDAVGIDLTLQGWFVGATVRF